VGPVVFLLRQASAEVHERRLAILDDVGTDRGGVLGQPAPDQLSVVRVVLHEKHPEWLDPAPHDCVFLTTTL
jgi:hypothetical protein